MRAKEHRAARFPLFIVCICCSIVRNKPNFEWADYSACVVYNKTIIHLSVGESGGYLPPLRLIVNYLHGAFRYEVDWVFTNLNKNY